MNARLSEIQSAILNVKFPYLKAWNEKRVKNANRYMELLENANLLKKISLPKTGKGNSHTYHLFVILTKEKLKLHECLKKEGISSGLHYPKALPYLSCYKDLNYKTRDFPVAQSVSSQSLALPLYPQLTDEHQKTVVEKIKLFYS